MTEQLPIVSIGGYEAVLSTAPVLDSANTFRGIAVGSSRVRSSLVQINQGTRIQKHRAELHETRI
jgi:uncharacterized RmlC-like cupin family protein